MLGRGEEEEGKKNKMMTKEFHGSPPVVINARRNRQCRMSMSICHVCRVDSQPALHASLFVCSCATTSPSSVVLVVLLCLPPRRPPGVSERGDEGPPPRHHDHNRPREILLGRVRPRDHKYRCICRRMCAGKPSPVPRSTHLLQRLLFFFSRSLIHPPGNPETALLPSPK